MRKKERLLWEERQSKKNQNKEMYVDIFCFCDYDEELLCTCACYR